MSEYSISIEVSSQVNGKRLHFRTIRLVIVLSGKSFDVLFFVFLAQLFLNSFVYIMERALESHSMRLGRS